MDDSDPIGERHAPVAKHVFSDTLRLVTVQQRVYALSDNTLWVLTGYGARVKSRRQWAVNPTMARHTLDGEIDIGYTTLLTHVPEEVLHCHVASE